MGFITLKPEGYYRGKKNTKQMMIEWVLEESHVVNGVKIDVTQASPVWSEPPARLHWIFRCVFVAGGMHAHQIEYSSFTFQRMIKYDQRDVNL